MSWEMKCVCDVCGANRGLANHWLLGYECTYFSPISDLEWIFYGVRLWDDGLAKMEGVHHLCGAGCMQKKLAQYTTRSTMRDETPERVGA